MGESMSLQRDATAVRARRQWLRVAAFMALALTFAVILKGAYTRLVDAGLGCPDWPGCYGFIGVPNESHEIALAEERYPHAPVEVEKGWPEMIHRYMAASLGLCIIGIVALAWSLPRGAGSPRWHALSLLALVILQGLFGMWTVTLKLWPQVVTGHLLGGFATFTLLALLCLRLVGDPPPVAPALRATVHRLGRWPLFATCVLVIQIGLGGWLTSNYAALACTDFPTCQGQWWPAMDPVAGFDLTQDVGPNYLGGKMDNEARVAIHMAHRLGAVAVILTLLAMIIQLWRVPSMVGLRPWLALTGGLLVTQVALGLTNILALLPLAVAVAHNGVAALLLVCTVTLTYKTRTLKDSAS